MCGLVGYFTNHAAQIDIEKMQFLLMLSSTRGKDSTGVASVIRYGNYNQAKEVKYHYLKSPVHPVKFTELPEWRNLAQFSQTKGWMGHTRAATVGAVNANNAHPFESANGRIVGSHNGTLVGDYPFKDKDKTDSEALMNIISTDGLVGLNKVNGAWALSFLDTDDQKVNLIRNRERPLFYMRARSGDFAYASESWMLETLKSKFNMLGDIVDLEPYKLLTLDLNKENYISTLSVDAVEGLEAPKVTTYGGHSGFFRGEGFRYGDWEEREHEIQRHGPLATPRQSLPVSTPTRSSLIADAVQKRKEAAQKASEPSQEDRKVIGLDSERKLRQPTISSSHVERDSSSPPITAKAFIKGLIERQRILPSGDIEVETAVGHWVPLDDFLDLLDTTVCKWTDKASDLEEERHWINPKEFICDEAWTSDEELRQTLGVDPQTGKPISSLYFQ